MKNKILARSMLSRIKYFIFKAMQDLSLLKAD